MLKHTTVQLELLTDTDILLFIERGIGSGISQCCNRYGKANNKYMGADYYSQEENNFLMYFDVNNLYGWAITQALPFRGFIWKYNISNHFFFNIPDNCKIGCILEIDLEYSESLHDAYKYLSLRLQHIKAMASRI